MKKFYPSLFLLAIFIFSACTTNNSLPSSNKQSEKTPTAINNTTEEDNSPESQTWNLNKALASEQSIYCQTIPEEGDTVLSFYFEGEKQRFEGIPYNGKLGYMINDNGTVYLWNDEEETGLKYNLEEINDLFEKEDSPDQKEKTWQEPAEIISKHEKSPLKCEVKTFPAQTFSPPQDIFFKDLGETFKTMATTQAKFKDFLPSQN